LGYVVNPVGIESHFATGEESGTVISGVAVEPLATVFGGHGGFFQCRQGGVGTEEP